MGLTIKNSQINSYSVVVSRFAGRQQKQFTFCRYRIRSCLLILVEIYQISSAFRKCPKYNVPSWPESSKTIMCVLIEMLKKISIYVNRIVMR